MELGNLVVPQAASQRDLQVEPGYALGPLNSLWVGTQNC
jgi:hypothetical protein